MNTTFPTDSYYAENALKAKVVVIPKNVIAHRSSKLDAATIVIGMPFLVP